MDLIIHSQPLPTYGARLYKGYFQGLGVVPVAAAAAANPGTAAAISTAAAAVAQKIGPIVQGVSKLANKIGIGGVSQDRFFERYFDIRDAFIDAGYLKLGTPFHENALDQFKIRKTQVKDKGDNYTAEFERLHKWVDYILNNANPGLGNDYRTLFPQFKMANQGNMYGEPITVLKEILKAFPPGTYTPGLLLQYITPSGQTTTATVASSSVTPSYAYLDDFKATPDGAPNTSLLPYQQQAQASAPAAGSSNMETALKITAGVLILGAGAWYLSKKKKLNGLGDLDTARTAKGRKKQRSAVFAKLDEEGKSWPKRNGVRKKPRKK